jgi:hypothetical protein
MQFCELLLQSCESKRSRSCGMVGVMVLPTEESMDRRHFLSSGGGAANGFSAGSRWLSLADLSLIGLPKGLQLG